MKKINKKGFSLVELLAVIAILGILSGVAIIAYNRYTSRARNDSYKELAESAINGAQQYFMDHPRSEKVFLSDLLKGQYINNINDPSNKKCYGKVERGSTAGASPDPGATPSPTPEISSLQSSTITAFICCPNHNYQYDNDKKTQYDLTNEELCN